MKIQESMMNNVNHRFLLSHRFNQTSLPMRQEALRKVFGKRSRGFRSIDHEGKDFEHLLKDIVNSISFYDRCAGDSHLYNVLVGPKLNWFYKKLLDQKNTHLVYGKSVIRFVLINLSELPEQAPQNFMVTCSLKESSFFNEEFLKPIAIHLVLDKV
jgi:hypothetical protein